MAETAAMDLEKYRSVVPFLCRTVDPYAIVIFGSAVRGSLREDSDIDIAFLSEQETDEYQIFLAAGQLAEKLGRDVDLVDLKKASTVFKAQVIGYGKAIYVADANKFDNERIRILKEYALLNEEREEILKAIRQRKQVYLEGPAYGK